MDLVDVRKTSPGKAVMTIDFAGSLRLYDISYSNADIFVVNFPDDFTRLLHLLPVAISRSVVSKLKSVLTANENGLPYTIELEKEILALV